MEKTLWFHCFVKVILTTLHAPCFLFFARQFSTLTITRLAYRSDVSGIYKTRLTHESGIDGMGKLDLESALQGFKLTKGAGTTSFPSCAKCKLKKMPITRISAAITNFRFIGHSSLFHRM